MASPTLDSTSITLDSTAWTLDQVSTVGTWSVAFSSGLQAPINLSNPTGSLSLTADPATINAKVSPVPGVGQMSFVGAAVKMALAMSTNAGGVSFASVTPTVISGVVTSRVPSTGAVVASGAAPTLAVAQTSVLSFPRVMLVGVGGDQGYGRTNGYPWTTAAAGTLANNFVQQVGAYDIAILSGATEGWDSNGTYDRDNLTKALGKSSTTYAVTKNNTRATLVFYYSIMNVTVAGNPYAQWQTLVNANNWFLYPQPAGGGTATSFINYSAAWPGAIGNAGIGASICGSNYGTTSSGSPTGAQGPARTFGNYASIKLLMRAYTGDTRFSFNAQMGSPSAAGIFLDECFVAIDGDASTGNASLDGVTIAPGTQQGGGFPGLDTVQPVMARGNRNMFDQMQTMLALVNPGKTYYNFANFGQYANKYQFGTATLNCGLESTLHGGLLENVIGSGASAWECYQIGNPNTGNTTYPSGALNALANYYQGMDFCLSPKLVGVGVKLPALDGSVTASWPVGAGTTLTTVTAGSALEYQLMRCSLCMTLMDDGYWAPGCTGYDWSKVRWYDEAGDDSLTQVNVKRGYLGTPLETRPNSPFWAQGPMGVWKRDFTGGRVLWNPRGNGAQTVALGSTYTKLLGTQQPTINNGASVSSVALADGDGLILLGPDSVSISGGVVTINRAAGGFGTKATAAPLYYNNFEGLSVGALPSAAGLTNSLDATVVNVQNDRSFTGTKCLKGILPANTESFPEVSYLPPANTAEIYVSGMMYWTTSNPSIVGQSNLGSQFIFKLTRMGAGQLYHGQPSQYQTVRPNTTGAVLGGDWGYTTGTVVAWPSAEYWGSPNTLPGPHSDQWAFMEWSHKFGNPSGSANGYSEMRCNAQNAMAPTTISGHSAFVNQATGANLTTGNTNNSGADAFFSWVITFFDGLSGPGNTNTTLWVDELYIDNCRNRVVVTDNAVFANSTPGKFLMLVPSVWNDKQIAGTNAALSTVFPSGSTANFHVFNNLGAEVANYSKVMP